MNANTIKGGDLYYFLFNIFYKIEEKLKKHRGGAWKNIF